ncbi:dGTP triphosphohydrolase [Roseateles chitosanitabidus]|uniref:dGTP triphosphohydrolase n=1 Tax=Roseateles chitosanitabidus TaxID=65048 RepID=UPI000A02D9D9|nr:dNTP triphosphohydrolase [Roseateles chitosanitabidus]
MRDLYDQQDHARALPEREELDVGRSPFRRDYGRLLHSAAFRRLQGKTQLFPGHESDFFRNRLTHSLEVAQVAKGIAQLLNARDLATRAEKIDLDLVEFAGLAHDLGHPPFGHNGERALDECMKAFGGFEGNAQTLRILTRVEKKVYRSGDLDDGTCGISVDGIDKRLGINATFRGLAAVLKYDSEIPVVRGKDAGLAKGYYESEKSLVASIKSHVGQPPDGVAFKTLECQIMDIADDIAYSTYDLEDAMKGGFTHPMKLLSQIVGDQGLLETLRAKVAKEVESLTERELYESIGSVFMVFDRDEGPLEMYTKSKLIAGDGHHRSEFSSAMIGRFMRGISLEIPPNADLRFAKVLVERPIKIAIEAVKHLNYLLTIMSPRLKVVEFRGFEVVQTIFSTLTDEAQNGHHLLPDDLQEMYRRLKDGSQRMRLVCDFVAGMTDGYAVDFYGRLKESGATIFKPF